MDEQNVEIGVFLETLYKKYQTYLGIFIFLLFSFVKAHAQDAVVQEYANPSNTIITHRNEKIHGTPFYNKDWEKGRVLLSSNEKTRVMNLKYKIFTNELLFKKNGSLLAVKPGTYKGFYLMHDGHKVIFSNGINAPKYNISPQQSLQVIYSGKTRLFKRYTVKFHRGQRPDPFSGVINSRFHTYKDYFLLDEAGKIHKVKLKKKNIMKALASHKNEIETYAKSKRLQFDKLQDLKKILQEYDEMAGNAKK